MSIISNLEMTKAVSRIKDRAERQEDLEHLAKTYVDVGILPQIDNDRNQIMYGRRGTGKTHILRYFARKLANTSGNIVSYIDCRTLGSTTQYSDIDIPLQKRVLALFQDILNVIYPPILEHIVSTTEGSEATDLMKLLDELIEASTRNIKEVQEALFKDKVEIEYKESQSTKINISGDPTKSGIEFGEQSDEKLHTAGESEYKAKLTEKIYFPEIYQRMKAVLEKLNAKLFILIDEWSSLPSETQPYLAEFLRKSFFATPKVVIKIASLEYRSNFSIPQGKKYIGFELGSDISANLDIDDYYVFDRNPDAVLQNFADIVLRHLESELPDAYLKDQFEITSGDNLVRQLFSDVATFKELVRASEGVIRDLINIFIKAYYNAHRRSMGSVDKRSVTESARQWYESDKSQNLDEKLSNILRKIVTEVIGNRKARSFLIPRELETNPLIQKLFDSRVIHVMQRGYADKENPGLRYNIYTLDYGTYVDLLNTKSAPQIELFEIEKEEEDPNIVVPFDDKRSIRRIILSSEILK